MAGNANSGPRKQKLFRDAIMMQLKIRDAGDDSKTLRDLAEQMIETALTINPLAFQTKMAAIKELADRIDGKPAQQVDLGNPDGEEFKVRTTIERIITDPSNPNS